MIGNKINKIMAAILLTGAPLLWSACADTWNEHYDVTEGGMADQPSLLENIAADKDLSNFYDVLKAIGATEMLNSPQQFTIWAPKSLTAAQKDSIIKVYEKDEAEGLKWEDNKAITQFLQNHMALYARPVSPTTNDTVTMRNQKYMHLVGTSTTSGSLNGNPFNDMKLCNNGILYKVENLQQFFPNVREFTEHQDEMKLFTEFLKSYDEYELDLDASTPGGVVDGKTVYLDSVTTLYNRMLSRYGYIQREDSVYTFIAPTDDVWNTEYERYNKYFNYNKLVNNADSLANINTVVCIIGGRFFNTSENWRYNLHPEDSLCNTTYFERQSHMPRTNVYYKPMQGILNGLQKHECSNGFVYVDDKGVIDPRSTFFTRTDLPASSAYYYEIPKDANNVETMNTSTRSYELYEQIEDETTGTTAIGELLKRYNYVQVTAKTSSANTEITYKLPQTLSNVFYNVYVVTVPDHTSSTPLPTWFQVQSQAQRENGAFGSKTYLNNPHPVVNDGTYANADVILKQGNNQRCFVSSAEKMDTILIQSGMTFEYSGAGVDDAVVKLTISSFGPSGSSYREKIYTRTLRLNEIILVPFETKEEAEAAADDKNAFNDDILEALKEN